MGNRISCVCNSGQATGTEVEFSNKEIISRNFTFAAPHVKSAMVIQNKYRKMKGYEQLLNMVKQKILKNGIINSFEELNAEDFTSLIKENIKQILLKLEHQIRSMTTIKKGRILVKFVAIINRGEGYYNGEYNLNGDICGLGMYIMKDGSVYYGFHENNKFNGEGTLICSNGDYYVGQWKDGMTDGKGLMIFSDLGIKYDGEWKNNMRHGKGEEIYSQGSIYKGQFIKNEKHGEGLFVWPDGTFYKGSFVNSKFNGYGEVQWSDGRMYKGNWTENKMNGKGIFTWNNGNCYKGDYKNDKKFGEGTFYWNSNAYYTGQWMDNKQHGNGFITVKDKVYNGLWRYGKIIRINEINLFSYNTQEKNDTQYFTPKNTFSNATPLGGTLSIKNYSGDFFSFK